MKADNRGMVLALRRAVKEGDRRLADYLTDEIVRHLDLLDAVAEKDADVHRLMVEGAIRSERET